MAGITSDVFDIFHPTPVPLRELSAIVISLEIWRCEINKYRSSNTLKEFRPSGKLISLRTILIPYLPSMIYPMIDKYVKIFGHSMSNWLRRHHRAIFNFHFDSANSVLEYFEDFICDYDGTIHYDRTAKRMMQCDRFDVHQKFLIACTYCFEDDIVRIGPLGLKKTDSLYKKYSENLQFYYWIDFLENHIKMTDPHIAQWWVDKFMPHSRSSLEYFWSLISSEDHLQIAIELCLDDLPSFVRFILPKLDDQLLNELDESGCDVLYTILINSCFDEEVVLSTWIYVENSMNEISFTNLIVNMLQSEVTGVCVSSDLYNAEYNLDGDDRDLDNFLQLCFEIWNTAAENLKRSAVRDITSNNRLFEDIFDVTILPPTSRELKFLLAVLSYATDEQKNAFWHNCWQYLIYKTRVEDLDKIMRLCLRDEDEITEFKKNIMANDMNVLSFCSTLIIAAYFDELNEFVRFLLPEMQATSFKQRLLHPTSLKNNEFPDVDAEIVQKLKEFGEFIKNAHDTVDRSTDFKNELMWSPLVQKHLSVCALFVPMEQLAEFIDTFVPTERILLEVKTHVINFLKKEAAYFKCRPVIPKSSFVSLLSWCLEDNEEFLKFLS